MRDVIRAAAAAALLCGVSALPAVAKAPVKTAASANRAAEDARLTAFLDAEFEAELKMRPQLATRLGSKVGEDRLDDISDAAALRLLEWRRGSVAKMKAGFSRAKLSPEAQANYDIWAYELERAELAYRNRAYSPPFYSFLYSAHSQLPNFLANTHNVQDASDMRAYNARLRAIPAVLDEAIAQSKRSDAAGVRAPKFEIERVIEGSKAIIAGTPFGDRADSP